MAEDRTTDPASRSATEKITVNGWGRSRPTRARGGRTSRPTTLLFPVNGGWYHGG